MDCECESLKAEKRDLLFRLARMSQEVSRLNGLIPKERWQRTERDSWLLCEKTLPMGAIRISGVLRSRLGIAGILRRLVPQRWSRRLGERGGSGMQVPTSKPH
jgi:hypothetical protein